MTAPAAGWYPDPSGSGEQRWWDGYRWTGNTRPVLTFPTPDPPAYQPAGYPAQPSYPPAQPSYPPAQPGYGPAQPSYPPAQPSYPPAQPGYGPAQPSYPPAQQMPARPGTSLVQRNKQSFTALAVIAVYLLLALFLHIVLFGILPILFAVRAVRAREQLAIPVAVLSGLVLIFALYEVAR